MDNSETFRQRLPKMKRYKDYIIVNIPRDQTEEVVEPDADGKKKRKDKKKDI